MEKGRKTRVIAILALVVAVVGMSLGFAAFSNILTISSSATVTPSEDDFKMVAYGLGENYSDVLDDENFFDISYYTSTEMSVPLLGSGISAQNAIINRNSKNIKIENLSVNFIEPGDSADYLFAIKNEGEYDAYINASDILNILDDSGDIKKVCTPGAETTSSLVESACSEFTLYFFPYSSLGSSIVDNPDYSASSSYKIVPNDYIILHLNVDYSNGSQQRADGEFLVQFENLEFEFTSVPKGTVLNP